METNVALVGGGTAGHIMPNFALLPYVDKLFDKVIYIGSENSMEQSLCQKLGVKYFSTATIKFERKKFFKNLLIPFVLIKGIFQARKILKKENISVLFSKGGYAALPSVYAAHSLGIPIACHESDRSVGLANKLTMPLADRRYTAFPKTLRKAIVVPTPVRDKIFRGKKLPLFSDRKPTVLFMGGSLGAEAINDVVAKAHAELVARYNVIHIAGKSAQSTSAKSYICLPFSDNIEDLFASADLVVCRAGASTLGELTALGKRTLAIPLPKGNSRGDQEQNAAYYESCGLITKIEQCDLTPDLLLKKIALSLDAPAPTPTYDKRTPEKLSHELYNLAAMKY